MAKKGFLNSILLLLSIITLIFSSCKKTKLKGEKEILVGEWQWTRSEITSSYLSGEITQIITPYTTDKTYSLRFYKKGKVAFFEDGKSVDKVRIYIPNQSEYWNYDTSEEGYFFRFQTKGIKKRVIFGYLYDQGVVDTLKIRDSFPFQFENCKTYGSRSCRYDNYYIRVK